MVYSNFLYSTRFSVDYIIPTEVEALWCVVIKSGEVAEITTPLHEWNGKPVSSLIRIRTKSANL